MAGGAAELHRGDEVVSAGALSVYALISLRLELEPTVSKYWFGWMWRYRPPDSAQYGGVFHRPLLTCSGVFMAVSRPVSLILCSSQSSRVSSPCSVYPRASIALSSLVTSLSLNVCNPAGPIHGWAMLSIP